MKEITRKQVEEKNLKLIGRIANSDFSKVVLMMERFSENKKIKYYMIDLILYDEKTQKGDFRISFWGD